jgi:antitoxin MazE
MIVQFAKWGNSLALVIPTGYAQQIAAVEGKQAEMTIEDGSLIITPVEAVPNYALDELLSKVTPENLHGEISTGFAVGNEFS